jgi:RimJ/RimL family protein N-acetyltransferase
MTTMPLTTERLRLRAFTTDDAPRLLAIRSDPEVVRWQSDPTPWTDLDQALTTIAEWAQLPSPLGVWAIVPVGHDQLAGTVSLKRLPGSEEVEIGWSLHPDATGNGYAREAARLVLAHAFAHGIPHVWAVMWPQNERSARVAAAAGMHRVGVHADPWYGTEQDPDSLFYRADADGRVPDPVAP